MVVMPSMPGMLMSISTTSGVRLAGQLDGFRPGCGRPDDLEIALEAEQLGEVVAGLRDVVDDEDADLVWHRSVCWSLEGGWS